MSPYVGMGRKHNGGYNASTTLASSGGEFYASEDS